MIPKWFVKKQEKIVEIKESPTIFTKLKKKMSGNQIRYCEVKK